MGYIALEANVNNVIRMLIMILETKSVFAIMAITKVQINVYLVIKIVHPVQYTLYKTV